MKEIMEVEVVVFFTNLVYRSVHCKLLDNM